MAPLPPPSPHSLRSWGKGARLLRPRHPAGPLGIECPAGLPGCRSPSRGARQRCPHFEATQLGNPPQLFFPSTGRMPDSRRPSRANFCAGRTTKKRGFLAATLSLLADHLAQTFVHVMCFAGIIGVVSRRLAGLTFVVVLAETLCRTSRKHKRGPLRVSALWFAEPWRSVGILGSSSEPWPGSSKSHT